MIIKVKRGRDEAGAAMLIRYLLLAKLGKRQSERLCAPPVMTLLGGILPLEPSRSAVTQVARSIARQLSLFTQRMRGSKPAPQTLFLHLSVNFHPSDEVSPTLAESITKEIIGEVMGADRPTVIVAHGDTHLHTHGLVGVVSSRGVIWNAHEDYRLWEAAAERAEIKYGLYSVHARKACAKDQPDRMPREKAVPSAELHGALRKQKPSAKSLLQSTLRRQLADSPDFGVFIEQLARQGVSVQLNEASGTGHISGVSFRIAGSVFRGCALGKTFAWKAIASKTRFDARRHKDVLLAIRKAAAKRSKTRNTIRVLEQTTPIPPKPTILHQQVLDLAFLTSGNVYAWRNTGNEAFRDEGDRITMDSEHKTAVKAALQLAMRKHWSKVEASGSLEFQTLAVAIGKTLGIEVVVSGGTDSSGDDSSPVKAHTSHDQNRTVPEPVGQVPYACTR